MKKAVDLGVGEGFEAVIVELDADGDRVDVGDISPAAHAGLPGAEIIVEHMVHGAVAADDIVGAYLGTNRGKGREGLRAAILCRMMDDHEIGLTHIEIGRTYPVLRIGDGVHAGGERVFAEDPGILLRLVFVLFVRSSVRVDLACGEQEQEKGEADRVLHNKLR